MRVPNRADMKNAGLVVLAIVVVVLGWRLAEITREKTSGEHARLATELNQARTRIDELAAEVDRSHEQLEAVAAEREKSRMRTIELERASTRARDKLVGVRATLAKERADAAALGQELAHAQAEKSRVEQESRKLRAQLDVAERRRSKIKAELAAMTHARERVAVRLNELEGTVAALRRMVSTTAGELGRAQSKAADLTTQYERVLTDKEALNHLSEARLQEIERIRVALENAQSEVARLTNARGIYTVKESDSLSIIAAFFYANGNYWPRIMEANSFLIGDDPDLIFEGMVLIIP